MAWHDPHLISPMLSRSSSPTKATRPPWAPDSIPNSTLPPPFLSRFTHAYKAKAWPWLGRSELDVVFHTAV